MISPFASQTLAAIATTPAAIATLLPFCREYGFPLFVPPDLATAPPLQSYGSSLSGSLTHHWNHYQGWIFGLATGAVVRLIAPLLKDKATDPAVIVVDPTHNRVISLCGGHQGGGDRLTQLLATYWGGTAILTGAAQGQDLPGVDVWGEPWGWRRGAGDWTGVSGAIARHAAVQVQQGAGTMLWRGGLPASHALQFEAIANPDAQVWIDYRLAPPASCPTAAWHPRVLWVGLGCERGTSLAWVEAALTEVLTDQGLAREAIAGIATLDRKGDEVAFLQLCEQGGYPLRTFTPEELAPVAVPTPSSVVAAAVGTPSVAEAAALRASGGKLLVEKRVFSDPKGGAVTVAIALAPQEYTGRPGDLALVGMGPGALSQMTPAAQMAIAAADVVIGYSLYLDLIQSLRRPGQIWEALPITQEVQRAERGATLARWGLSVAVVSSGDCGIYGMAGLVMETLVAQGWDGKTPRITVLPGITALQAAASRVGAPLMHDFCAVSLSDLLTPWDVIVQRLTAAAQGDFVTALYNPRSRQRQTQIATAQSIFLQYRDRTTPVALVQSAYRPEETLTLTTLGEMLTQPIDMLTTVLIGNSNTRRYEDWLITPRGYLLPSKNPSGKRGKGVEGRFSFWSQP